MVKIKALIFDMDDTLVNSSTIHRDAFNEVIKKYGANINDIPKKIEKTFFGKKLIEIAKDIIDYFSLDIDAKKLLKEREKLAIKMLYGVKPLPGLKDLLKFLRSSDYKIVLATSSPKRYADIIIQKFEMSDVFANVVSGEEAVHGKPDPQIFKIALKKIGSKASESVIVEDSENGVNAAKKIGIKVIGIVNPVSHIVQDLSEADITVKSLSEIKDSIGRLQ
jgi:HAD superfamily hydrolase (TIGR01509 family)